MFDVTSFLLRWLYLCNMGRDIDEMMQVSYYPPDARQGRYHQPGHDVANQLYYGDGAPPIHGQSMAEAHPDPRYYQQPPSQAEASTSRSLPPPCDGISSVTNEDEWKQQTRRCIDSWPSRSEKLLAIDSLRIELVQELALHLQDVDDTLERYHLYHGHQKMVHEDSNVNFAVDSTDDRDPYFDEDTEIVREMMERTLLSDEDKESEDDDAKTESAGNSTLTKQQARLVISERGTEVIPVASNETEAQSASDIETRRRPRTVLNISLPSKEQTHRAYRAQANFTNYLPQLISAVLKSPPGAQPHLADPIRKLRRLLLTRCAQDANWGIEFCWLLEAMVGRTWKRVFEHRQKTGRRLIIVAPEDKALALAEIGTEKREAFDLLQDAEQATAFGLDLPSSLSQQRCSHFGDTMTFVDLLTQLSLDLRKIPAIERTFVLQQELEEINRRLRRRMVSRGTLTMDLADGRGPYDAPHSVPVDVLKHSVHFPLEPQRVTWPGGEDNEDEGDPIEHRAKAGVMRVLHIHSQDSRLLSSRERCPFLIHMEVAETGLEGSDSRLYASGKSLGTTIEESLGIGTSGITSGVTKHPRNPISESDSVNESGYASYKIPRELVAIAETKSTSDPSIVDPQFDDVAHKPGGKVAFPSRGGDTPSDDYSYYSTEGDYVNPHEFDPIREQQFEQLHQNMHNQPPPEQWQDYAHEYDRGNAPTVSTRSALLDRIYGIPWKEKCDQIRQASAYGHVRGWRLASFIVKAGEDIRREALAMQLISKMANWFTTEIPENLRPIMRPYTIMCVGEDAGLLECLTDAKSVDEVKKRTDGFTSLRNYFERAYGPSRRPQQRPYGTRVPFHGSGPGDFEGQTITFEKAQDNFLRSLVGYSLVCYILQIKDRHNANILLDREGRMMHIDFGYVLGDTTKMGKVPLFSERAPFKLSGEFWDVLGGWDIRAGGLGVKFCKMFEAAFACASSHSEEIISMAESALMNIHRNPSHARHLANGMRNRLRMRGAPGSERQKRFIIELVNNAITSWSTSTYDWLQKNMNGYQ